MRILIILILLATPMLAAASQPTTPISVFVSVLPLKTFVQQVGGQYVRVQAMVRPGFSPETYAPTPKQIAALADARLYIRVGVPFENAWMARIRSANPNMQILDARQGLQLEPLPAHHPADHDQHAAALDPHVWTSPPQAEHMVKLISHHLGELDPAHAAQFRHNAEAYIARLQRLNKQIETLLAPLKNRRFLVFHPAWGYFARTYHLNQIAIQNEGKQPGARMLASLIAQARQEHIRVVFVQPQFDRREASQVAQAIGGRVIAVNPLATDYIANLRSVAEQLAKALGHE